MSNLIEVNYKDLIAPHFIDVSKDIFQHKYTHYYFTGGRGSGKSSKVAIDVVVLLMANRDVNALVLRKVAATLRDSVFNQILWAIDLLQVNAYFKATTSPFEITYKPTGQKIFFRGADDPIKIKSIKPKKGYIGITWLEELDGFSGQEDVRSILQSTNRGGEVFWNFYSYNPPKSRDNWVNVEKLEHDADRFPDTVYHHSTYETVPVEWLGEQFIIEAEKLKEKRPQAYEHEYLGVPTGSGGAVFENVVSRAITDEEMQRFDRLKFGVDFGFAVDPFAWGKMHFDRKNNRLYLLDEIYEQKMSNRQAAERIRQKYSGGGLIVADSSEPKSIAEMRGLGLNIVGAKKGPDSVEYGIKFLQDLDEIVIDKRRTPNAHREFTLYEYERTRSGEFISSYPDKGNHWIDLCRYACESEMLDRRGRIQTSHRRLIY